MGRESAQNAPGTWAKTPQRPLLVQTGRHRRFGGGCVSSARWSHPSKDDHSRFGQPSGQLRLVLGKPRLHTSPQISRDWGPRELTRSVAGPFLAGVPVGFAGDDDAGLVGEDHCLDPVAEPELGQDPTTWVFTVFSLSTKWSASSALE